MQQQRLNPNAPVFTPRSKLAHPLYPAQPSSGRPAHIACINARSIKNKHGELSEFIEQYKPDVIGITETWLSQPNSLVVPGYDFYRRDRPTADNKKSTDSFRGLAGVALLVRSDFPGIVEHRTDLQLPKFEAT